MKKLLPLFLAFALSCADRSATNIDLLIRSSEPDDLIMGFYLIGESKDTKYVNELFHNVNDPRISHDLRFYGMSVYQSKMAALRNMSGLEPPKRITYKPDSVIISFYYNWADENGYLK